MHPGDGQSREQFESKITVTDAIEAVLSHT